ncbi:MAG TPA: HAMP domain-containing sensor histidine kinase [Pseudobacteroides sp.]|uniref:sensor histidine kinase n=1 Tax=Pseudobacteroides sp. TaxID=1968840 RepID=UPI002F94DD4A
MKLRLKVISMNMFIIVAILLVSGIIIIRTIDNFNLYTSYQYVLSQSKFTEQYLTEYLKISEKPHVSLELNINSLEEKLRLQSGCGVEISGSDKASANEMQKNALEGKKVYLISSESPNRKLLMAFPIIVKGSVIGTVSLEYSLYQADSMKRNLQITLVILLVFALSVSLVLSYLFSYRMIKPLEKLTLTTKEYSKGNFNEIGGVKTGDEIEKLAHSFNDMGRNIKDMIDRLTDEQQKQKKFIDSVTHEIRTPLTNIIGYADLSGRVNEEEQRKKYYTYIIDESKRLLNMVNNLLDLSQLNQYEFSVTKKETDLKNVIIKAVELMRDRAGKFGIGIDYQLEDIRARVDGEKIKQVVINIIDNAIKYSEGSLVKLKLWREQGVFIEIRDNGIGIPKDDIKSITEPFYRVDKSRSRKLGGNGLGLSICMEIIDAHGGKLDIDSPEGEGTIVTISLQP